MCLNWCASCARSGVQAQPNHVFFAHCADGVLLRSPPRRAGRVRWRARRLAGLRVPGLRVARVRVPGLRVPGLRLARVRLPVYASPVYASPVYASPVYASPRLRIAGVRQRRACHGSPPSSAVRGHRRGCGDGRRRARQDLRPAISARPEVVVLDTGLAMAPTLIPHAPERSGLRRARAAARPRTADGARRGPDRQPARPGRRPRHLHRRPDRAGGPGRRGRACGTVLAAGGRRRRGADRRPHRRPARPHRRATRGASSTCRSAATRWRSARCWPPPSAEPRPGATSWSRRRATTASAPRPSRPRCPTWSAWAPSAPTVRALFSNYGPWVRACAPGVDLVSTFFAGFLGAETPASPLDPDPDDFDGLGPLVRARRSRPPSSPARWPSTPGSTRSAWPRRSPRSSTTPSSSASPTSARWSTSSSRAGGLASGSVG